MSPPYYDQYIISKWQYTLGFHSGSGFLFSPMYLFPSVGINPRLSSMYEPRPKKIFFDHLQQPRKRDADVLASLTKSYTSSAISANSPLNTNAMPIACLSSFLSTNTKKDNNQIIKYIPILAILLTSPLRQFVSTIFLLILLLLFGSIHLAGIDPGYSGCPSLGGLLSCCGPSGSTAGG